MRKLALITAMLIIPACTTVDTTKLKSITTKNPDCSLDVYSAESEITRPYEIVCLIGAQTGTTLFHNRTGSAAVKSAKPKACECGADAILVDSSETTGATLMTWGQGSASMKAIKYTGGDNE